MWKRSSIFILPGLVLLIYFLASSCGAGNPGEDSLLLYARVSGIYGSARFSEVAELLSGERRFPPALVLRGKAEFFSGDLEAAEKSLRRALRLRPGETEAALFLARILREKGEAGEAETLTGEILGGDPQDIRALRLAADLARDRGPSGEAAAVAFLDRAVEASSESALIFLDRARLRWIGGDGRGALDDLVKAKGMLSADNPLHRSIINLERAINSTAGGIGQ